MYIYIYIYIYVHIYICIYIYTYPDSPPFPFFPADLYVDIYSQEAARQKTIFAKHFE